MNDQQLDKVMRQLAADTSLDESATNEIANSPSLWWRVQREINNAPQVAPWPPNILKRFLIVAMPLAAAIVLGLGLYLNNAPTKDADTAVVAPPFAEPGIGPTTAATGASVLPNPPAGPSTPHLATPLRASVKTRTVAMSRATVAKTARPATEIKSEFIALAYARDPESGQLIRVKVPSSMMVTLGLVSHVEKPSDLVDAEVIVGDDGLTRAIRFIRQ
jgi:hypothetical protein